MRLAPGSTILRFAPDPCQFVDASIAEAITLPPSRRLVLSLPTVTRFLDIDRHAGALIPDVSVAPEPQMGEPGPSTYASHSSRLSPSFDASSVIDLSED